MTSPSAYVPGGARESTCKAGEVNLFQLAPGKGPKMRAGQGQGKREGGEEAMRLSKKPGRPQSSLQESSQRRKQSSNTSGKTRGRKVRPQILGAKKGVSHRGGEQIDVV